MIGWGVPKRGSVDRSLFLSLDTRGAEWCMACRPQSMAWHMTCLILTMDIKPRHRNLCHRISSCFSCCIIYNPKSRKRWKRKVVNNFILEKQNALYNCFLKGEKVVNNAPPPSQSVKSRLSWGSPSLKILMKAWWSLGILGGRVTQPQTTIM